LVNSRVQYGPLVDLTCWTLAILSPTNRSDTKHAFGVFCAETAGRNIAGLRGGGGSGATGSSMIFDGIFGSKEPKGEPTGKFVQHAKLEGVAGAFGPPGIIIGGLGEDELEVLGDAVERVLAGPDGKPVVNVPFLVLGKDEVSPPPNVNPALRRCSRIKSST